MIEGGKHTLLAGRLAILLILSSHAIHVGAQPRVLPGNVDADGFPVSPARICLGATGTAHCYIPPDNGKASPFGLAPKASTIAKLNSQDLTRFTATFDGGGSGSLTNFALLTVRNGEFVNLLPKVQLTNQSEYGVWSLPQFSNLPVLATADFVWDFDRETHFAYHCYQIELFGFDATTGSYRRWVAYKSAKKYKGLDETDVIHVLEPEKPTILAKLQQRLTP